MPRRRLPTAGSRHVQLTDTSAVETITQVELDAPPVKVTVMGTALPGVTLCAITTPDENPEDDARQVAVLVR